ncbi:MAG: Mur ligase domain-containing protein [Ruthenibacterium sp.]
MQSIAANTLLRGLGTLVDNPVLTGVVTDSRAVKQGSLFVCIAGERVDGHAYAKQALRVFWRSMPLWACPHRKL